MTEEARNEEGGAPAPAADETKNVGRGALFLTITKFWFLISGYAIYFGLPRLLGPGEIGKTFFGKYSVVTGFGAILNALVIQGTTQAVSRFVGRDPANADGVRRAAYKLQALIGGGLFLIMFSIAPIVAGSFYDDPSLATPLRAASFILLFYAFYAIFMGYLNGRKLFTKQALADFSYSTLKIVGVLGGAVLVGRMMVGEVDTGVGTQAALDRLTVTPSEIARGDFLEVRRTNGSLLHREVREHDGDSVVVHAHFVPPRRVVRKRGDTETDITAGITWNPTTAAVSLTTTDPLAPGDRLVLMRSNDTEWTHAVTAAGTSVSLSGGDGFTGEVLRYAVRGGDGGFEGVAPVDLGTKVSVEGTTATSDEPLREGDVYEFARQDGRVHRVQVRAGAESLDLAGASHDAGFTLTHRSRRYDVGVVGGPVAGFAAAALMVMLLAGVLAGRSGGPGSVTVSSLFKFQIFTMAFTCAATLVARGDLQVLRVVLSSAPDVDRLAAEYTAAQAFATIPFQAVFAITFVLFPLVSGAAGRDEELMRTYVKQTTRYAAIIATMIGALFLACPERTITILFPSNYSPAAMALRVLAIGYLCYSVFFISCSIITASGKPWVSLVLVGCVLVIQVGLGLALAGTYEMVGVACATTSAMLVGIVLAHNILKKSFGQGLVLGTMARIALCGAITGGIAHVLLARTTLMGRPGLLAYVGGTGIVAKAVTVAGFGALCAVYVVLLLVTKALDGDDRAKFMKVLKR